MTKDVFIQALNFSIKYDPFLIIISGGEPTDHPDFLEFMRITKDIGKRALMILMISNGLFLSDKKYRDDILSLNIPIQITHDKRYYKKPIEIYKHKLIKYIDYVELLSPFGRALKNKLPINRTAPVCFNTRSLCDRYRDFHAIISKLRIMFKFCSPTINIDGSISIGESSSCYKIGTIFSSGDEIVNNILNMKCGRCGIYKSLPEEYRLLIEQLEKGK